MFPRLSVDGRREGSTTTTNFSAAMSAGLLPEYFMAVPPFSWQYPAAVSMMEEQDEDGGAGRFFDDEGALDFDVFSLSPPMDRAAVASKNHRDAERRRRERIKSHLDRLRTILACDPKTDKASLLARTVELVKDLKQQTEEIIAQSTSQDLIFPTETDEIVVLPYSTSDVNGSQLFVFEASLCCEDRSDLLPELIETLRSLGLTTLRAEIATLGGRVRNVLLLAKEKKEDQNDELDEGEEDQDGSGSSASLTEALKAVVHRQGSTAGNCKRQRLIGQN